MRGAVQRGALGDRLQKPPHHTQSRSFFSDGQAEKRRRTMYMYVCVRACVCVCVFTIRRSYPFCLTPLTNVTFGTAAPPLWRTRRCRFLSKQVLFELSWTLLEFNFWSNFSDWFSLSRYIFLHTVFPYYTFWFLPNKRLSIARLLSASHYL